nr:hypothetical protein [Tanacetum cinerariifolium]
MNVFVRIGFGSTIELVSFEKSQMVTFNSKFVCGFRNNDCGTESKSDHTIAHIGSSSIGSDYFFDRMELFCFIDEVFESEYVQVWVTVQQVQNWKPIPKTVEPCYRIVGSIGLYLSVPSYRWNWQVRLVLGFKRKGPNIFLAHGSPYGYLVGQDASQSLTQFIEFDDSYKAPQEETGKGPASESFAKKKGKTLRFNKYETTKELWEAILKTFGGNEATKKTKKNQLKQQYGNFKAEELWEAILKTFGGNEATKKTKKNQLKQQYGNFKAEGSETLEQTFNRMQAILLNQMVLKSNIRTFQIDKDDIEEIDIKWNMALLSMRADRFWKKTGKKITIQGSDVVGFHKSKVECFNCHKIGHFARECGAPRSQDRCKRESYKQGLKEEELAPKALMAIDGIGWDWSYMANEEENHALVADEEASIEFSLMAKSSSSFENEVYDDSFCFKSCLERDVEVRNNKIEYLMNELEQVKKEKEGLDIKLTGFKSALKYLNTLLGSQRIDKNKEGIGYSVVLPPPAQVYSPPKKDLSWTGLPEFVVDTVTNYKSSSSLTSKPTNKFVKAADCPEVIKTTKIETARKSPVKYAEMYKNTSKSPKLEPYYGGYVSFGHGGGKITGKDFKLKDDTNVLLRTPRQHNMYSIDLKNVSPHKNLTCLVGKASVDESMLWHRRFTWTFFLRIKDETSGILRNFITEIENLKDLKVKIFRCDNKGEFKNREMSEFCTKKRIIREFSNAKTPQQNKAKAVNTACYVQNRVVVNKSQNKTPYELFNSRSPTIGFLRPFGCHVVILNKLDHLGSLMLKGMKVTLLEENMHVDFLENKLIEKGAGPNWLFDIDTLTNSMNSVPVVVAGTSSTNILATKDVASQDVKKDVSSLKYIALLNCGISNPTASSKVPPANQVEPAISIIVESKIPTISSPVPTVFLDNPPKSSSGPRLITKDTIGVEADLSNTESSIPASLTPTFRIHKDHPKSQIIGPVDTLVQTRHKSKEMEEHSFIATIHQKTNLDLLQFCLFLCFLSQKEPKMIFDALKDPSWVEDMQEELLQLKIQNPPGFQDLEFLDRVYKVEKALYGLHQAPKAWYDVRPDIMFAVCAYARHQVTPKECHLHAVKRIFRYPKGHPKLGLWYPKDSPFELVAYSDSNYGGATQDQKSTTRGCQFLRRRLISWQCKKHTIVATFTIEVEYVAAASGCGQVLLIQN